MDNPRIVVVGSMNMDFVATAHTLPRPGESVIGTSFAMLPGGKGANQAVQAARLGAHVTMVGRVGADDFGRDLINRYRGEGMDTSHIRQDERAPTCSVAIHVGGNGENDMIVVLGANARVTPSDVEEALPAIERAGALVLQNEIPAEGVLRAALLAKERGVMVILNPAPAAPLPDEIFRAADLVTPNEREAEFYSGMDREHTPDWEERAAEAILRKGAKTCVITLGKRGCFAAGERGNGYFPAFKIDPVDTTAAGDAFNGALAFALAGGQKFDAAIFLACAAGAFSASRAGAMPSLGTLAEIRGLIDSQ